MIVKEMYEYLKEYIEHGCGDYNLVITLREPSIGARAGVEVSSIHPGFDWESGQMRIEPSGYGCTSFQKDRDIPCGVSIHNYDVNGKNTVVRRCKFCGEKVRKYDKFCCKCGHKLRE